MHNTGWYYLKLGAVISVLLLLLGSWPVAISSAATTTPVLLVVNNAYSANRFGLYLGEILRAEGLNAFDVIQLSSLTATDLTNHDLTILAETSLNSSQATLLTNYVNGGGRLLAMRPVAAIKDLFGLGSSAGTLSNGYVKMDTAATLNGSIPGQGLSNATLQIHGDADRYSPAAGAVSLAQLYSNATTSTSNPAVISAASGRAIAFTYDLARNVVYTRQSNPANGNVDTDGDGILRTIDLFQRTGGGPPWVDRDKIPIPQADEQQRLFARLVKQLVGEARPLPQLWYFPGTAKTMLIPTGDAHANPASYYQTEISSLNAHGGTATFYLSQAADPNDTNMATWRGQGYEFGIHPRKVPPQNLAVSYAALSDWWDLQHASIPQSRTVRNHQVAWEGWTDAADTEVAYGMALDTNFYHWGTWLKKPDNTWPHGYITGSGQPMKFIRADGTILPLYQQLTQLVDEHLFHLYDLPGVESEFLSAAGAINVSKQLIDASQAGDYAALMTQFHVDYYNFGDPKIWAEGTLDYATSKGVPIWNADRWLRFTETRHDANYSNIAWDNSTKTLTFDLSAAATSGVNLSSIVPLSYRGSSLQSVKVDGSTVSYSTQTIKGVNVAFITVSAGNHSFEVKYQGGATVPALSINDVSVTEGDTGTTNAIFTVSLTEVSTQTVSVNYATANSSATAPADYASTSGVVTFTPGVTSQPVMVTVQGDTLDEADETFLVNLSAPSGASLGDGQGIGTILNDDPTPSLSLNDVSVTEGDTGTTNATFTISLSEASGQTVTVSYSTANSSAVAPADYVATSGVVTFTPGTTSRTINVAVQGDTLDEINETYLVNLSNPNNADLADGQGVGTIVDDDLAPTLSLNDASVTEGNVGTTNASFTVSLSEASGQTVTVSYNTANSSAVAPADYVATSGVVTFTAGTISRTITVSVQGDTLDEVNETYLVNLSNPNNASVSDGQGIGTILDDDSAPTLSVNDVSVTEGDVGTVNASFTVSLSAPSSLTITVGYSTTNGSAVAPADYIATSGVVTFAPGTISRTISVVVQGDTLDEVNETYLVNLSNPNNVGLSDSQGQGTILDDDGAPGLSINDMSVSEGNAGTTNVTFTVLLSESSAQTVTVAYATADNTAGAPADYLSQTGVLTFAPGTISRTITVSVQGDTLDEVNETYLVNLNNPNNASVSDGQGIGTILDDDSAPTLSLNDVSVTEGNVGTTNADFTISLSAASGQTVTVSYSTANGSAGAPADYLSQTGVVTFAPGTISRTITVSVQGDTLDEVNEIYLVNLSNPNNAGLADGQGIGTIVDDDSAPTLSLNDVSVTEGNVGTTNADFTVSLSEASGQTVTVSYNTANSSAVAPADYVAASGVVTFTAGTISRTINVAIQGDTLDEVNETYLVNLSNPNNASVSDGQGIGTIVDDDSAPTLSLNDVSVTEGNVGTTNAGFTVSLSAASGQTVTVSYSTANSSAVAPADYVAASGVVTFTPGTISRTISVVVQGDTLDEADEIFRVNLSEAVNAGLSDSQGQGTILDDDGAPGLSINDMSVSEGNAGTTNVTFTVLLSESSAQTVTVAYATADNSAGAPADYLSQTGVLTFTPGVTSQAVTIIVNGDEIDEPNETFWVNLSKLLNAVSGDSQGQAAILDDDSAEITVAPTSLNVAEGGLSATYTLRLASRPTDNVTITPQPDSQVNLNPGGGLTFTPASWNIPQSITVAAVDDTVAEGSYIGVISHTVSSADPNYNGRNVANVSVTISDNDAASPPGNSNTIFLPLIFGKAELLAPDLVVQNVNATSSELQLVIKNQGNAPVTDPFWVDAYLNPNPVPTGVNQIWYDGRSTYGAVWGVTTSVLPLAPGATLTLTVGDAYYWPSLSQLPASLAPGTKIYAQVDSANLETNYGGVLESHEITGQAYNNIIGPILSTAEQAGNLAAPGPVELAPDSAALPPRRP